MSALEETVHFQLDEGSQQDISEMLTTVCKALSEKGYNPINQVVGYILSGDPAYIPRNNNARNLIRKYERDELVEELVRSYLEKEGKAI